MAARQQANQFQSLGVCLNYIFQSQRSMKPCPRYRYSLSTKANTMDAADRSTTVPYFKTQNSALLTHWRNYVQYSRSGRNEKRNYGFPLASGQEFSVG